MSEYKFEIDEIVTKIGGSYQADGVIKARFLADDGSPRYVFRFDNPPGLLHIFNENQLESLRGLPTDYPIEVDERDLTNKSLLEKIRDLFM